MPEGPFCQIGAHIKKRDIFRCLKYFANSVDPDQLASDEAS